MKVKKLVVLIENDGKVYQIILSEEKSLLVLNLIRQLSGGKVLISKQIKEIKIL